MGVQQAMHRASLALLVLVVACTPTARGLPGAEEKQAPAGEDAAPRVDGAAPREPSAPVDAAATEAHDNQPAPIVAQPSNGDGEAVPAVDPQLAAPEPWPKVTTSVAALTPELLGTTCEIKPGKLEVRPKESGEGELPFVPRTDSDQGSNMDHIERFGWSKDGLYFVYCQPVAGLGCPSCMFASLDGTRELVSAEHSPLPSPTDTDGESTEGAASGGPAAEDDSECSQANQKILDDRLAEAKLGKHNTRWARGGHDVIVWEQKDGDWESEPATVRISMLARSDLKLSETDRRAKEILLVENQIHEFGEVHVEVIVPSPDGHKLAIMTHGFAGEYSDTMHLWIFDLAPREAACP